MSGIPRFAVGSIACQAVSDGAMAYPREVMFVNASADELTSLEPGEIVSPYNCLLIRSEGQVGLVDTGLGGLAAAFGAPAGRMLDSLAAAGVSPDDVDVVAVSHAHPDHVGGLTRDGRPVFRGARHHMRQAEWDFWTSETARQRLPEAWAEPMLAAAATHLPPLRKAGVLDLVSEETEVLPGVRLIAAPGHTPGHAAIEVSSDGETALWLADALLHELNFARPELLSVTDVDPELTVRTRGALLERAAAEGALVGGFHLPRVGRVQAAGDAYQFVAEPSS